MQHRMTTLNCTGVYMHMDVRGGRSMRTIEIVVFDVDEIVAVFIEHGDQSRRVLFGQLF